MPIENVREGARPYYRTQEQVDAAHPMGNSDKRIYAMWDAASEMVSERHGKGDLIALVTSLLLENQKLKDEVTLYRDLGKLPDDQDQREREFKLRSPH